MNSITTKKLLLHSGFLGVLFILMSACTLPLEVSYKSFGGKMYSNRGIPAKIHRGDVSGLLNGEYLLIGFIDIRRNDKKCYDGEGCSKINDKFSTITDVQIEASKNGGDVVFVLDKKFIVERISKSVCNYYSTVSYTVNGNSYTTSFCASSSTIPGKLESTISRALVWRHTPNQNNVEANSVAIAEAMHTLEKTYELDEEKNKNYIVSNQLADKTKQHQEKNIGDIAKKDTQRTLQRLDEKLSTIAKMSDEEIKKNCDIWKKTLYGENYGINITMLSVVLESYNAALKLIKNECGLEHIDTKGANLLVHALRAGNVAVLKALDSKRNMLGKIKDQRIPEIFYAAANHNPEIVEYLARLGRDVNIKLPDGMTPIFVSVFRGNQETFNALVKLHADPTANMNNGYNTLMAAVQYDHPEMIGPLLDLGVDINHCDNDNANALIYAAQQNNATSARRLMEKGIEIQKSGNGLSIAFSVAKTLNSYKFIKAYVDVEKKVEMNEEELVGFLSLLAERNYPDVMTVLIDNWNHSLSDKNLSKLTHNAASYNYANVIRSIGRKWQHLDFIDDYGNTPLMIAAVNDNMEAVQALLENHVDTSIKSDYGKTAYQIAVQSGSEKVVAVMRKNNIFN